MKVKLAKTAGFCMGVRRAMNIVLDAANRKEGRLFTYGPLVHNPQAVELLKSKGVDILQNEAGVTNATVIIRAHGVPPKEKERLKSSGNLLCDATCPHVARAHAIIKREIRKGYSAIIIGDRGHAEVNGLLGYADGRGYVVENISDLEGLPELEKACVVAQTTQDRKNFDEIVANLREKIPDLQVFDTICDSTNMRQKEVLELSREVDAMVIVGGKNSANTRRLYEISCSTGTPSFHIEGEDELEALHLEQYENIGVMAGASTPNWVINKVIDRIKQLMKRRKGRFARFLEDVGNFIIESSLYLSIGAVSMCYASMVFQKIPLSPLMPAIAFFYVFAVHVFNRYNERLKDQFFDPGRTRFFEKYGKALVISAMIAALASLHLSLILGFNDFLLLLFSYLMGIVYSVRIIPVGFKTGLRYKRLRDIPGSKDIFVALAWAWVIVFIPMLNSEPVFNYESMSMLAFVLVTVFTRSVVFDVLSIEGDRIVGNETIPILIGPRRTEIMLAVMTVIIAIYMTLSAAFGLIPGLGYVLPLAPAFMAGCVYVFHKKRLQGSALFEAVIDSSFFLTGLAAYLYQNYF
jgi:4-hydroxy-3-methylbut-2-enyl diphosphate reductase